MEKKKKILKLNMHGVKNRNHTTFEKAFLFKLLKYKKKYSTYIEII